MALFDYQATDSAGRTVAGAMDARDEKALVDRLQEMGYFPVRVARSEARGGKAPPQGPFASRRVSSREVTDFTGELCGMLEAGLPLDRALSILAGLAGNKTFREIILDLHNGIHGGAALADCMERYPAVFPGIYVSIVRAGETGGTLEPALERIRGYMEETQRLKDDVRSALIYPLLLTTVGGSAVALMLFFVIPKFSAIFAANGAVMPLPTRVLLFIAQGAAGYWWAAAGAAVAGALIFRKYSATAGGRMRIDGLKLKLPVFGEVMSKAVVSRFSRTLGVLMQGGLPILDALGIAVKTMGNSAMAASVGPVADGVRKGRGLAAPLKETGSFPPLAVHMLTVGEETGRLDEMLIKLADKYDRDISVAVKRLLSLLEPAIILVMAAVVGFIVISLLLAVFSLNDMPM